MENLISSINNAAYINQLAKAPEAINFDKLGLSENKPILNPLLWVVFSLGIILITANYFYNKGLEESKKQKP